MAEPKGIKTLAGVTLESGELAEDSSGAPINVSPPLNLLTLAAAVVQLQNTVNELIVVFNAHKHTENTAASYTQNAETAVPKTLVEGTGQSKSNKFTAS